MRLVNRHQIYLKKNSVMSEQTGQNKPAQGGGGRGGCVSLITKAIGVGTIIIGALGYIVGLFGMQLKVSGSKLPFIDLPMFGILAATGAVFLGLGWLISKIEDAIIRRKYKSK